MAVEEIVLFFKERRERKGEYKVIWIGLLQFPSVQGDEVVERPLYTYIVLYRIISTCSVEATKSGQKKRRSRDEYICRNWQIIWSLRWRWA